MFGWAFAFWGVGLYWWAGVLYAWQVRQTPVQTERPADQPACPTRGRPLPGTHHPAARRSPEESLDPEYQAVAGRADPGRGAKGRPAAPRSR